MIYNKIVTDCFFEPRHVGVLEKGILATCKLTGHPLHEGRYHLYVVGDKKGKILHARFKAYGNPYLIAGAEWICRMLEGTALAEHPHFDYHFLLKKLAIPKQRYALALLLEEGYNQSIKILKAKTGV